SACRLGARTSPRARRSRLREGRPVTQEEVFLQEILANPEDDTPRLVYADWLDDHGEGGRGEFIHLQCELARLPEGAPGRAERARRADELQAMYEEEWVGPLRELVQGWEFRRGFVAKVSLRAADFPARAEETFRL